MERDNLEKMFPVRGYSTCSIINTPLRLLKSSTVLFPSFSEEGRGSNKKEFTILFVPRKTLLCERKLTVSFSIKLYLALFFVSLH